jgi:hypothetical protein
MRARVAWLVSMAVALAAVVASPSAQAADPPEETAEDPYGEPDEAKGTQAKQLFVEGREALDRGDVALACEKFHASLALVETAGTLLNIAQCEERQGHLLAAEQSWERGIARLEPGDERIGLSQPRLDGLRARIPSLVIAVNGSLPAGLIVKVDDRQLSADEMRAPLRLDPGKHRIAVARSSKPETLSILDLREGEQRTLEIEGEHVAVVPRPPPPSPVREETTSQMVVAGWSLVGLGAAGLIVFGATGGVILSNDATIESECPTPQSCSELGATTVEESETLLVVNTVALAVGGAALGTGVILLLVDAFGGEPDESAVSVRPSPEGIGLAIRGAL